MSGIAGITPIREAGIARGVVAVAQRTLRGPVLAVQSWRRAGALPLPVALPLALVISGGLTWFVVTVAGAVRPA
jgi:hypothetical protein